jgi:hypothetical protein
MGRNRFEMTVGRSIIATICLVVFLYFSSHAASPMRVSATSSLDFAATPAEPHQFPIMDKIASKVIQKYQAASCEQLWQEKSLKGPKPQEQQQAIQILRDNPQMREAFLNKVAAPIANKMVECGMIP